MKNTKNTAKEHERKTSAIYGNFFSNTLSPQDVKKIGNFEPNTHWQLLQSIKTSVVLHTAFQVQSSLPCLKRKLFGIEVSGTA